MNKKAIVIGSGFGGIAVSLRLKKLGYDTTIVEKLESLGGRARVLKLMDISMMPVQLLLQHRSCSMNCLVYLIKKRRLS